MHRWRIALSIRTSHFIKGIMNMTNEEALQALQHLIGQPYNTSVKATVSQLTGRNRVVGANEVATKEMDPARIHIIVSASGTIEAFRFG